MYNKVTKIVEQISKIVESLETLNLHYILAYNNSGISNQREDCSNKHLGKNKDSLSHTLTKIILYEL